MPKEFENIRKEIKKSLREKFPNISEKELEDRSWPMAKNVWKKLGRKPF